MFSKNQNKKMLFNNTTIEDSKRGKEIENNQRI